MKRSLFTFTMLCICIILSNAVKAQKLSDKFPAQIKAIIAAVKADITKLKGESVSAAGEYKSKLPLEDFAIFYNEPEDDDPHVMARKAVETLKSADWMAEIAAALKKLPGYTVKDSYKDKDYFTGYKETTKHTLVLLKGEESVLTVIEKQEMGSYIEIWF